MTSRKRAVIFLLLVLLPLSIQKEEKLAGIFERTEAGLRFLRGFPRGMWGTALAPDLGTYSDSRIDPPLPWLKAKEALTDRNHSYDAQKDYEYFIASKMNQIKLEKGDLSLLEEKDKKHLFGEDYESLPILYLMWWCTEHWPIFYKLLNKGNLEAAELRAKLIEYCPSPCYGEPCKRIIGVSVPSYCEAIGPFEGDFKCQCRRDMEWDQDSNSCKPINPCYLPSYPACFEEGTLACVALDMQTAKCICNEEHMGSDCSQLRNACLLRFNRTENTGNKNCGVEFGNRCIPILGTDFYTCRCSAGWITSPLLPYENCALPNDPCTGSAIEQDGVKLNLTVGKECLNGGTCVSSPDLTKAVCVCPTTRGRQTHTGEFCEQAIGVWSSWTSMTPCRPTDCGTSRYRWRRRQCLWNTDLSKPDNPDKELSMFCQGSAEEIVACDETSVCLSLRLPGQTRGAIFNYESLFIFLVFVGAEVGVSILLWTICGKWICKPCCHPPPELPPIVLERRVRKVRKTTVLRDMLRRLCCPRRQPETLAPSDT